MKNKWPKRAPALLAAVALTASMFPTGALALEAERQDTAETVTAAVQQTPTPGRAEALHYRMQMSRRSVQMIKDNWTYRSIF